MVTRTLLSHVLEFIITSLFIHFAVRTHDILLDHLVLDLVFRT